MLSKAPTLTNEMDKLAVELEDVEGLVLAKIDATANEINDMVDFGKLPAYLLHAKGEKDKPVKYFGKD
eukprot:CAMPEP_0202966786 /NCGR_PEP_ID=MMETSP1396-20130829/11348_1 /ASSEMBLY_ACC=CAM_ASM_000872 /TAXON_ID= /ORGANISM="Pseudokeronopsis sp., Strain Brazil" /LENGTH=67 /DNA_ID=CAMNT_0049691033 /DNA_START=200 /DNA_END=400 /DNA_ORIENTATION=-